MTVFEKTNEQKSLQVKNKKNTFLLNLITIFIIVVFVEGFLYVWVNERELKELREQNIEAKYKPYSLNLQPFDDWYQENKNSCFRKPEGLIYNKKPIIIFGCSFAYGFNIELDETVSYKLSRMTKRPIYNRAVSSWGVQHMLYQLRRDDFYKEVKEPEYIIYVYIDDHTRRLYNYVYSASETHFGLIYEEKNGRLNQFQQIFSYMDGLYINKALRDYLTRQKGYNPKFLDKNFDFMKLHFIESKKEIKKHYPHAKIVILVYQDSEINRWSELEKEGFIVIKANDLIKDNLEKNKYKTFDHVHPNGRAWDFLLPKLIEKLNL